MDYHGFVPLFFFAVLSFLAAGFFWGAIFLSGAFSASLKVSFIKAVTLQTQSRRVFKM